MPEQRINSHAPISHDNNTTSSGSSSSSIEIKSCKNMKEQLLLSQSYLTRANILAPFPFSVSRPQLYSFFTRFLCLSYIFRDLCVCLFSFYFLSCVVYLYFCLLLIWLAVRLGILLFYLSGRKNEQPDMRKGKTNGGKRETH